MIIYIVTESVSGESRETKANNPKDAVIRYLKQDIEVNGKAESWCWDFEVERKHKDGH